MVKVSVRVLARRFGRFAEDSILIEAPGRIWLGVVRDIWIVAGTERGAVA